MTQWLLDLFFPKRCLGCNSFGFYICPSCQEDIETIKFKICPVCTKESIDGKTHPGCRGRYTLEGLFSPFSYQGVVREALRRVKYKPWLTDLRGLIASLVIGTLKEEKEFQQFISKKPIIVPVPLHWLRWLTRGYNHAEILGAGLACCLSLSINKDALYRRRYTKPQFGLKKDEREKNISKAFALRFPLPKNSSVLLFDDVWTTGTTMRACANVLKRTGVNKVWGLTIAR